MGQPSTLENPESESLTRSISRKRRGTEYSKKFKRIEISIYRFLVIFSFFAFFINCSKIYAQHDKRPFPKTRLFCSGKNVAHKYYVIWAPMFRVVLNVLISFEWFFTSYFAVCFSLSMNVSHSNHVPYATHSPCRSPYVVFLVPWDISFGLCRVF